MDSFDKTARYRGEVLQAVRHGQGTYEYPEGGCGLYSYQGKWVSGVKNDSQGHFKVKGLYSYTGQFTNGEITGSGERKWEDGRTYRGDFVNGELHGKGQYMSAAGDETYEGEFNSNKRHGRGLLRKTSASTGQQEVYQGQFSGHKIHGRGKYIVSGTCGNGSSSGHSGVIVDGQFDANVITGPSQDITWNKVARFQGAFAAGVPVGGSNCHFSALDGSLAYSGPLDATGRQLSPGHNTGYLWATLDRTAVLATLAAANGASGAVDNDKKKAPPSNKKGDPSAAAAGVVLVTAGGDLGKLVVKGGSSNTLKEAEAAAMAAATAAAKGKPVAAPTAKLCPEPDTLVGLPCEHKRRCVAKLRTFDASSSSTQSQSSYMSFWLRRRALADYVFDATRFPVKAVVVRNGALMVSQAAGAVTETGTVTVTSTVDSDPNGGGLGMPANRLTRGGDKSLTIDLSRSVINGCYGDNVAVTIDFRLNSLKPANSSSRPSTTASAGGSSGGSEATLFTFTSDRKSTTATITDLENQAQVQSQQEQVDIPVAETKTTTESSETAVNLSGQLSLVLVVPVHSQQTLRKKSSSAASLHSVASAGSANTGGAPATPNANNSGSEVYWELRFTPAHIITITDVQNQEQEERLHQRLGSEDGQEQMPPISASESATEAVAQTQPVPSEREADKVIGGSSDANNDYIVVSRWADILVLSQWHSVALVTRRVTSADANALVEGDSTEANYHTLCGLVTAELYVDGHGRFQVFDNLTTLTGWLDFVTSSPSPILSSSPSEAVGEAGGLLTLVVMEQSFGGWFANLVVTGEGDRADPATMTGSSFLAHKEYLDDFALQRQLSLQPIVEADIKVSHDEETQPQLQAQQAADVTVAPSSEPAQVDPDPLLEDMPEDCMLVTEASLYLVCGMGDLEKIVVPKKLPPGSYALEISDGVHIGCCATAVDQNQTQSNPESDIIIESDGSERIVAMADVQHMARLVVRATTHDTVVIKVEA